MEGQDHMTTRRRYTLQELLAQCDLTAPRHPDEQMWLDMEPVGREFGAVRAIPLSRFLRERRSLARRGEAVRILRGGKEFLTMQVPVSLEEVGAAIRACGAAAGRIP